MSLAYWLLIFCVLVIEEGECGGSESELAHDYHEKIIKGFKVVQRQINQLLPL